MNSIEVAFALDNDLHWSYLIFRDCEIFCSDRKFDRLGDALEDALHWIETAF